MQTRLLARFQSIGQPLATVVCDGALLTVRNGRDPCRMVGSAERKQILGRFGEACAMCGRTTQEMQEGTLALHHVAFHAEQGATAGWNLIPLCTDRCHYFAHLGVWPRRLLWDRIDSANPRLAAMSSVRLHEGSFREWLGVAAVETLRWEDRIDRLLDLWRDLAVVEVPSSARLLELAARLQWELSKVVTTHGPAGDTKPTDLGRLPLNRYVGLRLNAQALRAALAAEELGGALPARLLAEMMHTTCAHLRGAGFFERSRRFLGGDGSLRRRLRGAVGDLGRHSADFDMKAYLLCGHALDWIRAHPFRETEAARKGRETADAAMEVALRSGDSHSMTDTALRQAESRIYSGMCDAGLRLLDRVGAAADADIPIVGVISHKLRMVALARIGDWSGAEEQRGIALRVAAAHRLDDQRRKVDAVHRGLLRSREARRRCRMR